MNCQGIDTIVAFPRTIYEALKPAFRQRRIVGGCRAASPKPVAISCGHRLNASSTVMFAWSARPGSLNPSRAEPLSLANSSSLDFTNVSLQNHRNELDPMRPLDLHRVRLPGVVPGHADVGDGSVTSGKYHVPTPFFGEALTPHPVR